MALNGLLACILSQINSHSSTKTCWIIILMSASESDQLNRLLHIMQKLRDPENGCPWDIKQTFSTIAPYTIEESYELADAIAKQDFNEIKDEIGDVLFQVVFYAQLGKEQSLFDFESIAEHLSDKLIRRHPHVFANEKINNESDLQKRWNEIKNEEKLLNPKAHNSILDKIPSGLPPLIKAHELQKLCAKIGFDWPDPQPVFDKIFEEIDEVKDAVSNKHNAQDNEHVAEEVGDLLFAVVNLARHLNVNADQALRQANTKFEKRFKHIEQEVKQRELNLSELSLEQLEEYWQRAKRQ